MVPRGVAGWQHEWKGQQRDEVEGIRCQGDAAARWVGGNGSRVVERPVRVRRDRRDIASESRKADFFAAVREGDKPAGERSEAGRVPEPRNSSPAIRIAAAAAHASER